MNKKETIDTLGIILMRADNPADIDDVKERINNLRNNLICTDTESHTFKVALKIDKILEDHAERLNGYLKGYKKRPRFLKGKILSMQARANESVIIRMIVASIVKHYIKENFLD